MAELNFRQMRVAFQGEPGAFSEAAAVQLLGDGIRTVPRATFDAAFQAIPEGVADAIGISARRETRTAQLESRTE